MHILIRTKLINLFRFLMVLNYMYTNTIGIRYTRITEPRERIPSEY